MNRRVRLSRMPLLLLLLLLTLDFLEHLEGPVNQPAPSALGLQKPLLVLKHQFHHQAQLVQEVPGDQFLRVDLLLQANLDCLGGL